MAKAKKLPSGNYRVQYLIDGKIPDWEVSQMKAKYYTTTAALEAARAAK